MPKKSLFTNVAAIGHDFLGLSRSQEQLQKYNWQLKTIWDLLKQTHSIVVRQLDAIQAAGTLSEAQDLAKKLEGDPLTDSFKGCGLCDIFEGYGKSMRMLTGTTFHADGRVTSLPVADDRKHAWDVLCDALEGREHQVATLYAEQLQRLGDLARGPAKARNLGQLKAAARKARDVLTDQMADFEALAAKFRRVSAKSRL